MTDNKINISKYLVKFKKIKKVSLFLGIILVTAILYFILTGVSGKTDDWSYSYNSPERWSTYVGILLAGAIVLSFVLSWIVIPLYLIVRGKPDESGENVKRKFGTRLLIGLLAFPVILYICILTEFWMGVLVITIIAVISIVFGIKYAFRRHVRIALVPLILILVLIPILLIGIISAFIFSMGGSSLQTSSFPEDPRIGLATGGAKDASNFRINIENDYMPLPTDITYEGLFYEYFFDTGETSVCEKYFCPSYSYALSEDPFSHDEEHYLQVGLNSGIKESDFSRKKLNLVIVLDISGSMSSSFNRYYYDQFGDQELFDYEPDEDVDKSKMEIASKAVVDLLDHLNEEDRFGMVLFDDRAYLAKPLKEVGDTDMDVIKGHILELTPRGGTQMSAGMKKGTELFDDLSDTNQDDYENRIIFLTDAMPNLGETRQEGLLAMTQTNARNHLYTTFIGIGVDFNTELVDSITKIRGANYYSVHSAKEFKTRMDDEFEYMVTPLVFNLSLTLDAQGFEIEKVYGSPEADEATGEIMKVNTLFPSRREGEETKGGIVILKLKKLSEEPDLRLKTSYEDRSGRIDGDEIVVTFPHVAPDYFDNSGIRKGILLSRYVNVMRNWIEDERTSYQENEPIQPSITFDSGIVILPEVPYLNRWERQSIPLRVSDEYKDILKEFSVHFEVEEQQLDDETLSKEKEILEKLINYE